MNAPASGIVYPLSGALPALHGGVIGGAGDGVVVIAVATTGDRFAARAQLRLHVCQLLARWLTLAPDRIALISHPGHAPRIAWQGRRAFGQAGLSLSHEAGLSLAAINLHGAVGVDLMRVPQQAQQESGQDLEDLICVARDYLGPSVAQALAAMVPRLRPLAFAKAWAAHEASLKCQGLALAEWTPSLRQMRNIPLALPAPFVGALAIAGSKPMIQG
jgi:4'-phosphopantetheinyl transferase